jgi:hypothetical protein
VHHLLAQVALDDVVHELLAVHAAYAVGVPVGELLE